MWGAGNKWDILHLVWKRDWAGAPAENRLLAPVPSWPLLCWKGTGGQRELHCSLFSDPSYAVARVAPRRESLLSRVCCASMPHLGL